MLLKVLGVSTTFISILVSNFSNPSIYPHIENNRHSKHEQISIHNHYSHQYQLKPKYFAFSRYSQTMIDEPIVRRTKSKKSKLSKRK
ncbi:8732_t:CDS:2 [Funneliformis geosporum]|uniref:7849_t:CDS:1 n=1 Tax=Funneliformis geosporum TaxID=1117311 RepID=A0A9W4WKT3_9GLOM|nr:8732_t:CDS:2 [Funneliformis geosporum]CAI2169090.1 7849_t:CDS:2 [Funneliformis geosporum]